MTPRGLALLINKKIKTKPQGFTLDVATGEEIPAGYFAIGGNVQPFGHFGALYYSPGTQIDNAELIQALERNWNQIQFVGHVGAWVDGKDSMADLFIDSTLVIYCDCGTDYKAARNAAESLGRKNGQIAIGHVCSTLKDNYETIRL